MKALVEGGYGFGMAPGEGGWVVVECGTVAKGGAKEEVVVFVEIGERWCGL